MDRSSIENDKMYRPSLEQHTKNITFHPEEEGSFKINNFLANVDKDINILDDFFIDVSNKTNSLLINTIDRLNTINDKLILEKERLQDIIILCNSYTDFEKTINLKPEDFTGKFDHHNGVIHCPIGSKVKRNIKIEDVLGNGYEGNKYVYDKQKKSFIEDTLKTDDRKAIRDSSKATYWEYSRITASYTEKYIFNEVNFDSEEAKCTLNIETDANVTQLELSSSDNDLVVSDVYVSNNGKDYEDALIKDVSINSKEELYENPNYIYGSGLISFKPSNFIKVTLESKGFKDSTIAFNRKEITSDGEVKSNILTELQTAKRHVVSINDLSAYSTSFSSASKILSKELITDGEVSVIALHCNTFLPEGLNHKNIRFILTVNGEDHEISPVNSHQDKTKIIRFSKGTMKSHYTKYINEKIKSAKLNIIMTGKNDLSPYINNIKILVGDEQ